MNTTKTDSSSASVDTTRAIYTRRHANRNEIPIPMPELRPMVAPYQQRIFRLHERLRRTRIYGSNPYTTKQKLQIGCTTARHAQIGVNAVVNARGGLQHLNDLTLEDIELRRDAHKIRDWQSSRVRFYQFNSRFFRKHQSRLAHLLSRYDD